MTIEPVGLLFDMTRCGGCRECVKACTKSHGLAANPETVTELSADARTCIRPNGEYNVRDLCRNCLSPSCASVCPVGALKKDERGPVKYDADKCIGCRYCMVACPFNMPRYEWKSAVPRVQKCDLCVDRLDRGEPPACAAACRQEATVFGKRKDLIAEAHRRIAESPDEYHPHVYGEHEVGGTSVLFLTPYPVEELGFKASLGTEPLPDLTVVVPRRIPAIVLCGGAALSAVWWITRRRDEVAAAENAAACAAHFRSRNQHGASPREDVDVEHRA
ncbi:MAG: 4Fe-4S dicluster domain-containing protein [Planctomycetes bacterium]|nr:4Fe-4S dicluster domain-containing protein [Planctomycetota bacterium]